ncbi:MAG: hypothetical protein A2X86_00060 [Bdellovibrionales bacterium GWA2_49_15]|nr:MAG: hypothetical protein A2X86_00060 [Bdellovibrionales bacterium GWA2_49_15]
MGAMTKDALAMPLEFVYLSTDLTNRNLDHEFIDCWVNNYSMENLREKIKQAEVVVLCSSPSYLFWRDGIINIHLVTSTLAKIKQINPLIKTILIGPHGTVIPESFNGVSLDFIYKGEPDLVVPQLISNLLAGISTNVPLPGVTPSKNGNFESQSVGVQVDDLASLAPMNFSKFKISDYPHPKPYGPVAQDKSAIIYEASRGCPYSCIYCFKVNFRDKFRMKPLATIETELRYLADKNVGYVYLIDEIFFMDRAWSTEVMKLLKKYHIFFGCQTRPSLLTKEMTDAIIELGMAGLIQVGLEHTDSEVLKAIRKGETDVELLAQSLHRLADAGITLDLFIVTGLPKDTQEKIMAMGKIFETFPMTKARPIIHSVIPLPGTKLWQMGQAEGRSLKTWDDIEKYKGVIGTKFKNSEEVNLASYQLAGRLREIEDAQRIKAKIGSHALNYAKLLKHKLDSRIPRVMRAITELKKKMT